jgi:hypothetical protein
MENTIDVSGQLLRCAAVLMGWGRVCGMVGSRELGATVSAPGLQANRFFDVFRHAYFPMRLL